MRSRTATAASSTRATSRTAPPISTHDTQIKDRGPFGLDSLLQGGPDIEVIMGGKEFETLVKDTKFMEEILDIRILDTGDPNAPKNVEVGVGVSGPDGKGGKDVRGVLLRNRVYSVPRFVVEVLAHAKQTALIQKPGPSGRPDDMVQELRNSFTYPFEVIKDPNPRGRPWLEKVLADPA